MISFSGWPYRLIHMGKIQVLLTLPNGKEDSDGDLGHYRECGCLLYLILLEIHYYTCGILNSI